MDVFHSAKRHGEDDMLERVGVLSLSVAILSVITFGKVASAEVYLRCSGLTAYDGRESTLIIDEGGFFKKPSLTVQSDSGSLSYADVKINEAVVVAKHALSGGTLTLTLNRATGDALVQQRLSDEVIGIFIERVDGKISEDDCKSRIAKIGGISDRLCESSYNKNNSEVVEGKRTTEFKRRCTRLEKVF